MTNYRKERVADLLQTFLATAVRDLHDPRLQEINITEARVAKDLQVAWIYWSMRSGDQGGFPTEDEIEVTSQALKGAVGLLRRKIADELALRHTPNLIFKYDVSLQTGARIEELLKKAGY